MVLKKAGLVLLAFLFKAWVLVMVSGWLTIFYTETAQWLIWGTMTIGLALIDTIQNYKKAWIFLEEETNEKVDL